MILAGTGSVSRDRLSDWRDGQRANRRVGFHVVVGAMGVRRISGPGKPTGGLRGRTMIVLIVAALAANLAAMNESASRVCRPPSLVLPR